jgi:hypothetical protein
MYYESNPLAQRLESVLRNWLAANPSWSHEMTDTWVLQPRDAAAVAADLLNDAELAEVRFAGFAGSPDGEMIRIVVGWILPYPYSTEFKLLVEAVTAAANAKQRQENERAGVLTIAALVLAGLLLWGLSS